MSEERTKKILIWVIIGLIAALMVSLCPKLSGMADLNIGGPVLGLIIGLAIATYLGTYVKYRHYCLKNSSKEKFDKRYLYSVALTAIICAITVCVCWRIGIFNVDVTDNTQGILDGLSTGDDTSKSIGNIANKIIPFLEALIATLTQALVFLKTFNRSVELSIKRKDAHQGIFLSIPVSQLRSSRTNTDAAQVPQQDTEQGAHEGIVVRETRSRPMWPFRK